MVIKMFEQELDRNASTDLSMLAMRRMKDRSAKIGIIGLGYVGLPLGLMLCKSGFKVTGFDTDRAKVDAINARQSYIANVKDFELEGAFERGFVATSDLQKLSAQDAIIVCVPTPLNENHEPDLTHLESAAKSIAVALKEGQLIVLESTTYPGTTAELFVPILEGLNGCGLKARSEVENGEQNVFYVAFSPEREDPGNVTVNRSDVPKVVGGHDSIAANLAAVMYETSFIRVVRVSSPRIAEMAKLLENIYRCVNIGLINELKVLCLRMGIDIWEVIDAASTKPFGFQPFYPGPGLGGHCIPVDPLYLSWKAREFDVRTQIIDSAMEVNRAMPSFVVSQMKAALEDRKTTLSGAKVLVLGVSYKPNIDDLRESPSLELIKRLKWEGAEVHYNDPYHPRLTRATLNGSEMNSMSLGTIGEHDCVLIATDHADYDYRWIVRESKLVFDTRNATRDIDAANIVRC